jgi:hypothetical protein
MSAHAARLARLFTPEYARRVNAQIVYPAVSVVVKPNELESALGRPLHVSYYEPDRPAAYLAATLSYGIIKGTFLPSFLPYFVCPIFTHSQDTRSRTETSGQVVGFTSQWASVHVALKPSSSVFPRE